MLSEALPRIFDSPQNFKAALEGWRKALAVSLYNKKTSLQDQGKKVPSLDYRIQRLGIQLPDASTSEMQMQGATQAQQPRMPAGGLNAVRFEIPDAAGKIVPYSKNVSEAEMQNFLQKLQQKGGRLIK